MKMISLSFEYLLSKKILKSKMSNLTNQNFSSNNNTILVEIHQTAEIGGLAYFLIYMSEYMPYVVISLMGTIIGVFGNLES